MVIAIDEQRPLNPCGVSSCCPHAFFSREEGLSCHSALSFKTTAGNSPPGELHWASLRLDCILVGSGFSSWRPGNTHPKTGTSITFSSIQAERCRRKDEVSGFLGKPLMKVKWVWKTLTPPVKKELFLKICWPFPQQKKWTFGIAR